MQRWGVTVSYFESVQNDMNFYWSSEEVLSRLDAKMTSAFLSVLEVAQEKGVNMREAAYMVAIDRVVRVCSCEAGLEVFCPPLSLK